MVIQIFCSPFLVEWKVNIVAKTATVYQIRMVELTLRNVRRKKMMMICSRPISSVVVVVVEEEKEK